MKTARYYFLLILILCNTSLFAGRGSVLKLSTYNPSYRDDDSHYVWDIIGTGPLNHRVVEGTLYDIELARKEGTNHPLIGLGESVKCPFHRTRNYDPTARTDFEDDCCSEFTRGFANKKKKYSIIFYQSGNLYSESMLVRRLVHAGYKNLNIACIDGRYEGKDLTDIKNSTLHMFRDAKCKFNFYSSLGAYRDALENKKEKKASLIAPIDFLNPSASKESLRKIADDLFVLERECLRKGGIMRGLFHTKDYYASLKFLDNKHLVSKNWLKSYLSGVELKKIRNT